MRVVGYARVSKLDEDRNPNALKQQVDRLKTYGCKEIYEEDKSATRGKRKEFEKVMQLVRDKAVDKVVFTRVDRLGRTREIPDIYKIFIQAGVDLIIIDNPIDLKSAAGRFHAHMLAELAVLEGELIKERICHGWEFFRKKQNAHSAPFGYQIEEYLNDKNEKRTRHILDRRGFLCIIDDRPQDYPIVNTSEWSEDDFQKWQKGDQKVFSISRADAAKDLIDIYMITKSIRKTLRTFVAKYGLKRFAKSPITHAGFEDAGIFQRSASGFTSWINNPVLRGHLVYFGYEQKKRKSRERDNLPVREPQIIYNTHPDQALMTEEEYKQIQTIFKDNLERKGFGSTDRRWGLAGLIKCMVCGSTCYSNTCGEDKTHRHKRDYVYFYCKNANLGTCTQNKYVRMDWVEDRIYETLREFAVDFCEKAQKTIEQKEDPEILKRRDEINRLIPHRTISGITEIIDRLTNEIAAIEQEKQTSEISIETKALILGALRDRRFWQDLDEDQKFHVYRDLLEKVEVKPKDWQPIANTNNKKKVRERKVDWEANVFVKFEKRPSKVLSDGVEYFLATHSDVEPVIVRQFNTTIPGVSPDKDFTVTDPNPWGELKKALDALQQKADEMNQKLD